MRNGARRFVMLYRHYQVLVLTFSNAQATSACRTRFFPVWAGSQITMGKDHGVETVEQYRHFYFRYNKGRSLLSGLRVNTNHVGLDHWCDVGDNACFLLLHFILMAIDDLAQFLLGWPTRR
jgi:hypothetical protein